MRLWLVCSDTVEIWHHPDLAFDRAEQGCGFGAGGRVGEAELADRLRGVTIPGIGFLIDLERTGPDEAALLREAEDIFRLAVIAGAKGVQVLTGPVLVGAVQAFAAGGRSGLYEGVLRHPSGIPDEAVLRDVPTGKGVLALRDWTEAVKSTGYAGWWSCEQFCRRQQQDDSNAVAHDLHALMSDLIRGSAQ